MYAIISDWMPFEIEAESEAPAELPAKGRKDCPREEEFLVALNGYMDGYRQHGAIITNKARSTHNTNFIRRFTDWIGG